jgi:hypothetical protein
MINKWFAACAAAGLCFTAGTAGAVTPFEADVTSSIDKGIEWLATSGAYNNPSTAGEAAGLTLLALLEKRPAGQGLDASPQGYVGASEVDKGRMRKAVAYILSRIQNLPVNYHVSYDYGSWSMALALYMRTGGPDRGTHADLPASLPYDLKGGLNTMFDRLKGYQQAAGYWSYDEFIYPGYKDSSTTQFVVAGLAALRSVYGDTGQPWADSARLAELEAMATKARQAYVTTGTQSLSSAICGNLGGDERGHGYNAGNTPSLQQTASGTWIQLVGGANINDPSVQGYLKWLRNRYRYTDGGSADGGWGSSHWYYMWSSSKAFLFLRGGGVAPAAGNISVDDLGTLPATSAPACSQRQEHRNPATDARVALFGSDGAGYYAAQPKDFYYDYAYTILRYQCADGEYDCNGAPSYWNQYSRQAYALLVLQRSVGGGCVDANKDGKCDGGDSPAPPQVGTCDVNSDGRVTYADVFAMLPFAKARLQIGGGNAVPPGADAANIVSFNAPADSGQPDSWFGTGHADTQVNIADFTRCIFKANGR